MPEPLLHDLAHDAPLPSAGFTDAVVAAGRRRLRRVRATIGATVGVVVVALAVPVAVQLGRTDATAPPLATASSPTSGRAATSNAARTPTATSALVGADELAVDTALIRHVESASGASVRAIEVRGSVCASAARATSQCTGGRALTLAQQAQILAGIDAHHPIRFVAAPAQSPPGSAGPGGEVLFLTLGPARITGNRATAYIQSWCGFDCVRGDGYVLARRAGGWQVTGSYAGYIS